MRVFVGIELDERVRESAAAISSNLRARVEALPGGGPGLIRWVPKDNLHLTLWFIGEVPEERARPILAAMSHPYGVPAFDLHIAGLGVFPQSGAPRVVWLGVRAGGEALAGLHDEVGARLRPFGIEPDRRDYSAHLTLARIKPGRRAGRPADVRRALVGLSADAGTCRVSALTVFRSRLTSEGAAYDRLLRVPLD